MSPEPLPTVNSQARGWASLAVMALAGLLLGGCASHSVTANGALAETSRHVAAAAADGKQVLALGKTLGADNAALKSGSDRLGNDIRLFQRILDMLRPKAAAQSTP